MSKFQFYIAVENDYEAGFETDIAYIQAIGPNGERFHTGLVAKMTEVDYDFDGVPSLVRHPEANRLLSGLQIAVREFEAGIRKVDVDVWSELAPQQGSQAWADLLAAREGDFDVDGW